MSDCLEEIRKRLEWAKTPIPNLSSVVDAETAIAHNEITVISILRGALRSARDVVRILSRYVREYDRAHPIPKRKK